VQKNKKITHEMLKKLESVAIVLITEVFISNFMCMLVTFCTQLAFHFCILVRFWNSYEHNYLRTTYLPILVVSPRVVIYLSEVVSEVRFEVTGNAIIW